MTAKPAAFDHRSMTMSPLGWLQQISTIAVGGRLDRVGPVVDGADDQPGLAGVADPGTARPSYRHIARLGKFEEALK